MIKDITVVNASVVFEPFIIAGQLARITMHCATEEEARKLAEQLDSQVMGVHVELMPGAHVAERLVQR